MFGDFFYIYPYVGAFKFSRILYPTKAQSKLPHYFQVVLFFVNFGNIRKSEMKVKFRETFFDFKTKIVEKKNKVR